MRRNLEPIEIKEPPIQEMRKKRSCLKRTCVTGCGCIVIFMVAVMLLLKFVAGPRVKELKKLPENFPDSIPVYDAKEISKITIISGSDKNRGIKIAAYLPKLIFSRIVSLLDEKMAADLRDVYQLEWTELMAEPVFIADYFQNELRKNKFIVKKITDTDSIKQFSFASTTIDIDGVFYLKDDRENKGTDYASLTVNVPSLNE